MRHPLFERCGLPGGGGPLYLQLQRYLAGAIREGVVSAGEALPSERDIAAGLALSRVTVRKAMEQLVREGVLVGRRGSGNYVAPQPHRVEQSLSQLTSFTEDMARRGMEVHARWLDRGLYPPSPEETIVLGLTGTERVARVVRLRLSGEMPLAIERASVSERLLPDPEAIETSLYSHLETGGNRPVRANQRIRAVSTGDDDAALLQVAPGAPALHIERTSYLPSGRVVEFTRSIYRGDTYDFVAELRLGKKER
ncbi:MAG TPA: GntR family transcriptional regulator [Devosia sp.]|jgi:GntR family transcriptional regulator|nr:GntR family transcriptional regulator [Devosia sp.]